MDRDGGLRSTIRLVVALNLGFFVIETIAALSTGSVSLFADSVDFLEDASINLLILAGLGWTSRARARLGMGLAAIILLPGLAAFVMAWHRFTVGTAPDAVVLGVTGLAALAVNSTCAILVARHRASGGSLTKAAFLSARNDTMANVAIIAAGALTAWTRSLWPDLSVGLAIACLNAGAAHEVFTAARAEGREDSLSRNR
ncbi:MAG: cation transporter [Beijerinckiaceae bacterium]|nr:cation transporter [Beijerinckiaceae bacterium]